MTDESLTEALRRLSDRPDRVQDLPADARLRVQERMEAAFVDASQHPERDEFDAIVLSPRSEQATGRRRRSVLVVAAATIVVLIGGVLALALLDGGSGPEPVDRPSTTTNPDDTTTSSSDDGSTAVDTEALGAIGEQVTTAFDTDDPDTIVRLISEDAEPISMFGAASKADLVNLFGWISASDWRFELQGCETQLPDQVECTVLQNNAWAAAAGAEPVEGTMFMRIEDGQVTAMRYGQDLSFTAYFEEFLAFVRQTDPEAADVMWATGDDGRSLFPTLTEESFPLFERYTDEFVASRADQASATDGTTT